MNRTSWKRPVLIVALAVVVSGFSRPAAATTITNVYSFSGSITAGMAIHPFDPALGTLNSVFVGINGVMTLSGTTGQNIVVVAPGVPMPVPYPYQISVTQDFYGLVGKYFDFNGTANFDFSGVASGAGESISLQTIFVYGFTFNATTDLVGFALPSTSTSVGTLIPPLGIVGPRSNFLQTIVPLDEIDMLQTWSIQGTSLLPSSIAGVTSTGVMQIDYNYTPAAAAVPEPGSIVLLTLGLCAVVIARANRVRAM